MQAALSCLDFKAVPEAARLSCKGLIVVRIRMHRCALLPISSQRRIVARNRQKGPPNPHPPEKTVCGL